MTLDPTQLPDRSARWLWILPFATALVVHAGALRSPLVLDDKVLVERLKETPSLSPSSLFFENYVRQNRVDRGFRPLTLSTLIPFAELAPESSGLLLPRSINLLLHAAVAVAVFLLILEVGGSPLVAALGATVFAVSPIQTDAVARIAGRAEILGTLCAVLAWAVALRNVRAGKGSPHESALRAGGVGCLTLLALLSKENDALLLPIVIALSAWALGRHIPWLSTASACGAILGYLAFRCVVLEDRAGYSSLLMSPLRETPAIEWIPHTLRHLFLYAQKSLAPWGLSAEYTFLDTPTAGSSLLIPAALGLIALIGTAALGVLGNKSMPLLGVGLASFFLLAVPAALGVSPQKNVFAERNAYLPGVGLVLGLSGIALSFLGRRRANVIAALAGLIVLFAARTAIRNEDWASADLTRLVPTRLAAGWLPDLFRAYTKLTDLSKGPLEQRELRNYMQAEADRILKDSPGNGWALAIQAQALFEQGKNAELIAPVAQAILWLESQVPPIVEPRVYRLRGEALLILNRDKEAFADLDKHVRLVESAGGKADPQAYSRLGLCLAKSGQLDLALEKFNAAIQLRQDQAELWNNRGFAKFKLGDFRGAVTDYQAGYEVCRKSNTLTSADGDSMHAFLLRMADVYRIWGEKLLAGGDTEGARTVTAEAVRYKGEAEKLLPTAKAKGEK